MSIESARAQVIASIWQALAQSGVDLSAIPQDQQTRLVEAIASRTMLAIDELLNEEPDPKAAPPLPAAPAPQAPPAPPGDGEEQVLWEGRPFLSMNERYTITTERIKVTRGLVGRNVDNYELIRVQDLDYSQGMSERLLGIGDVTISGVDPSGSIIVLRNIHKPEEVYELLRKAWLAARKRYGLQFREEM